MFGQSINVLFGESRLLVRRVLILLTAGLVSFGQFLSYDAKYFGHRVVTPTPDGTTSGTHPSVVDMGVPWNGYRYWMAFTPYYNSNNQLELPCILASTDRQTWVVPSGLTNPLQPAPGAGNHYDDPELVYNPDTGELWLYYIYASGQILKLELQSSSDGVHWSSKQDLLSIGGNGMTSPSVFRRTGSDWWLFYNTCFTPSLQARQSTDGKTWGPPLTMNATPVKGFSFWHSQVKWNSTANRFEMLSYDRVAGSTNANVGNIFAYTSANGTTWTAVSQSALVELWAYRPCFIYNGNGTIDLWYGALPTGLAWVILYRAAVPQPFDGYIARDRPLSWSFESGTEEMFWAPPPTAGASVTVSSTQHEDGAQSLQVNAGRASWAVYSYLPRAVVGSTLTAWLYDDGSPGRFYILRLRNVNATTGTIKCVGAGVYTGASGSQYVTHDQNFAYTVSGVARTAGWHRIDFTITDPTHVAIGIDGIPVGTGQSLPDAPQFFSAETYTYPGTYFVDAVKVLYNCGTTLSAGLRSSHSYDTDNAMERDGADQIQFLRERRTGKSCAVLLAKGAELHKSRSILK